MSKKKIILMLSLVLYSFCAVNNSGYYHYDEHFQIIEFAELKSGNNIASDLAWEYEAKIRSAIQPAIAYLFLESFRYIGITDPFTLMIILRLFIASFAIFTINLFVNRTEFMINEGFKLIYRSLSYFLWFLPFINCRFSSEAISGLIFLFALSTYFSKSESKFYCIGVLLCLSFMFRFQTAFMSVGFLAWLIFVEKIRIKKIGDVFVGMAITLMFGVLIDYWYYNSITFTFLNYFIANVVNDVASNYGVSPWYYYFIEVVKQTTLPIGILIWSAAIWQLVFHPKNLVIWIIVPFILVHMLTPHKEVRFLFPLANLLPLLLSSFLISITGSEWNKKTKNWGVQLSVLSYLIINTIALLSVMFSPADEDGRMNIIEAIKDRYPDKAVALWVTDYNNPFKPIPVMQNFYKNKQLTAVYVDSLTPIKIQPQFVNLLSVKKDRLKNYQNVLKEFRTVEISIGKPLWLINLTSAFGVHSNPLILFEINNK